MKALIIAQRPACTATIAARLLITPHLQIAHHQIHPAAIHPAECIPPHMMATARPEPKTKSAVQEKILEPLTPRRRLVVPAASRRKRLLAIPSRERSAGMETPLILLSISCGLQTRHDQMTPRRILAGQVHYSNALL